MSAPSVNPLRQVHPHHMHTACALHVHCMCTACARHMHCMCTHTACPLHVHGRCSTSWARATRSSGASMTDGACCCRRLPCALPMCMHMPCPRCAHVVPMPCPFAHVRSAHGVPCFARACSARCMGVESQPGWHGVAARSRTVAGRLLLSHGRRRLLGGHAAPLRRTRCNTPALRAPSWRCHSWLGQRPRRLAALGTRGAPLCRSRPPEAGPSRRLAALRTRGAPLCRSGPDGRLQLRRCGPAEVADSVGLHPQQKRSGRPISYGYSLHCVWLQPPFPTATPSIAYGDSPHFLRLHASGRGAVGTAAGGV